MVHTAVYGPDRPFPADAAVPADHQEAGAPLVGDLRDGTDGGSGAGGARYTPVERLIVGYALLLPHRRSRPYLPVKLHVKGFKVTPLTASS